MKFDQEKNENNEGLVEKKKIIYTLINITVKNLLNEMHFEGSFSNADVLLLLDDLTQNLASIISYQLTQLEESVKNLKNCKLEVLLELEDQIDRKKEKMALKITKKSFLSERSVLKLIAQLEKEMKAMVNTLLFNYRKCIEN